MSNYVECGNKIAFHPGYYIKEYIDFVGLTQEDFANRLGTTPKNISILIRGEQSISVDIATKLARLMGTTVKYWLNLQAEYDSLIADSNPEIVLDEEREVFKCLDYAYFRDNYELPDLPRKIDEQILEIRKFLNVSSLGVFKKKDMYVRFRNASLEKSDVSTIKANVMIQIATNLSLKKTDIPKYDKKKFMTKVDYALSLTTQHETFYRLIKDKFYEAGVDLIVLPNISGSKINGATKKIGNHIMLMLNDRNSYSDSFWFTLFHEIGHIVNGDFGVSLENEISEIEDNANAFAEERLIPRNEYERFVSIGDYSQEAIVEFADRINRDPGIVIGRLQKEKIVSYNDWNLNYFKTRYNINNK